MSTLQEIELAIERLSDREKLELRAWMDSSDLLEEARNRQKTISQELQEQIQKLAIACKRLEVSERALRELKGSTIRPSDVQPAKYQDKTEWAAAFERWIESNRDVTAVADDSRESIYAGRGE